MKCLIAETNYLVPDNIKDVFIINSSTFWGCDAVFHARHD